MIGRLFYHLIWEPGSLITSLGRNYVEAAKVRKYNEVFHAGIELGRRIERQQQEQNRGE